MTDIVDCATRSRMMAGIKSRDTKPELLIRCLLHRKGIRFRVNVRKLPVCPDIVLPRFHAAIFVNGCFWHGHDCQHFQLPQTRTEFWCEKIARNRLNDNKNLTALIAIGWRIGTVWECSLRRPVLNTDLLVDKLTTWLRDNDLLMEIRG